jgi:hypothetical protein
MSFADEDVMFKDRGFKNRSAHYDLCSAAPSKRSGNQVLVGERSCVCKRKRDSPDGIKQHFMPRRLEKVVFKTSTHP